MGIYYFKLLIYLIVKIESSRPSRVWPEYLMRLSFLSRLGIATMLRLTLWTLTVDTEDSQWRRCCTQCFISEQRAAYCWFISASTSMLLTVASTNHSGSGCVTTALWVGRPPPNLPLSPSLSSSQVLRRWRTSAGPRSSVCSTAFSSSSSAWQSTPRPGEPRNNNNKLCEPQC